MRFLRSYRSGVLRTWNIVHSVGAGCAHVTSRPPGEGRADVVDPSQPNDTADGQPLVRWSVKFPFNGPEVPIATGNPLQWRPSDQLPLGCATGTYVVIARVSNAAGETAVSREVYIVSPEVLCQ